MVPNRDSLLQIGPHQGPFFFGLADPQLLAGMLSHQAQHQIVVLDLINSRAA